MTDDREVTGLMINIILLFIIMATIFIASSQGSDQQDISPILGRISDWDSLMETVSFIRYVISGAVGRGISFLSENQLLAAFLILMTGILIFTFFYRRISKRDSLRRKSVKSFLYTMVFFFFMGFLLILLRSDSAIELIRIFVSYDTIRSFLLYIDFTYAGTYVSVRTLGVEGFLEFVIRKFAHFFLFGLLGFFLYLVIYKYSRKEIVSFILTVLFVIAYAALDEYRQSFIPSRAALVEDVVLDTAGGVFGTVMAMAKNRVSAWRGKSLDR